LFYIILIINFFLNVYLQDKFLGLNFSGSLKSSLEGDKHLSDDTSSKNMCTYTISKYEDFMKTSNKTRITLKMHNLLKDKGKVDYIPYENECDGYDDFPMSLRSIYKETFDRRLYCAWTSDQKLPRVYEVFQFWGYNYMIRSSNIHGENLRLFIVQNFHVGSKNENNSKQTTRRLMSYYGPSYYSGEWKRLTEYKPSISVYGLNSNMYTHRLQLESGK
jgi:hypothetical protein